MRKYSFAFHSLRRALYQVEPLKRLVPDLVVMMINPPLLRPFSAVNPLEMTCTSPTASMFGLTMRLGAELVDDVHAVDDDDLGRVRRCR